MALNIIFTGNIINCLGEKINDDSVKYQAFFKRNNSTLPFSKWGVEKFSEYGQYSLNLGDEEMLSQDGEFEIGDKIAILFWKERQENKESKNKAS